MLNELPFTIKESPFGNKVNYYREVYDLISVRVCIMGRYATLRMSNESGDVRADITQIAEKHCIPEVTLTEEGWNPVACTRIVYLYAFNERDCYKENNNLSRFTSGGYLYKIEKENKMGAKPYLARIKILDPK